MKFIWLVLLIPTVSGRTCPWNLSEDISGGRFHFDTYILDNVSYLPDKYFHDGDKIKACTCELKTCVKLCCPVGQAHLNETHCSEFDWDIKIDLYNETILIKENAQFHVIGVGRSCGNRGIALRPQVLEDDKFYIQKDGSLYLPDEYINVEQYCLSLFSEDSVMLEAYLCEAILPEEQKQSLLHSCGMIISMPFLLATLIVYALLPDKKNIHTKCQMAYVVSLLCAYFALVYLQFTDQLSRVPCLLLGFSCFYFFMTSFFWMNISCIDIFLTFSGKRGFGLQKHSDQIKRFAVYCSYAYGAPLIIIIITLVLNTENHKNTWYYANIGAEKCWFADGFPLLLYFYGPMGALILANMVLFILTALKIRQINKDTAMLRRADSKKHYENDKQTYNLYIKLLIAMGINWSLEFISWLVDWILGDNKIPEIWYVTDLCNALYGVFIFYLFVCKKSTWIMLQKRYYNFMGQHQKARALSTKTSNYNTSDTEKTNIDETVISTKV